MRKVDLRAIRDRVAFLLTELLADVKETSTKFGLEEPPDTLSHNCQLKKRLSDRFRNDIRFCKVVNRPTTTALNLTLHRITGSKEAISLLHHFLKGLIPGRSVHATFDNFDGKQKTRIAHHMSHVT